MDYLFVYGTLRRDFGHPMGEMLNSQANFFCMGKVEGWLYDLGEYPALQIQHQCQGWVVGDVYRKESMGDLLSILDEYEGVSDRYSPEFPYKRKKTHVFLEKEILRGVWVYEYQGSTLGMKPIPGGDYVDYLKRNR